MHTGPQCRLFASCCWQPHQVRRKLRIPSALEHPTRYLLRNAKNDRYHRCQFRTSLTLEVHSLHHYHGRDPQKLRRSKPQQMFRARKYRRLDQARILVRRQSPAPIIVQGPLHPRRLVSCHHLRQ